MKHPAFELQRAMLWRLSKKFILSVKRWYVFSSSQLQKQDVWFVSGDVIQHLSGCRQCDGVTLLTEKLVLAQNKWSESFCVYQDVHSKDSLPHVCCSDVYSAGSALLNAPSPPYSASLIRPCTELNSADGKVPVSCGGTWAVLSLKRRNQSDISLLSATGKVMLEVTSWVWWSGDQVSHVQRLIEHLKTFLL